MVMTILKGILLQGSINNLVGDKNRDLALTRTDTQTQTLTHIQTYKVKAITHKINKKNRTHTNRLNNSQTHIYTAQVFKYTYVRLIMKKLSSVCPTVRTVGQHKHKH